MDTEEEKKKDKSRPNHQGSVAAEDAELTTWLDRLWARNEPPERLELWQMFGPRKVVRGEMIFHEDFKFGEKLDTEQANRIANEIMEAAQNDCDSVRKESWYQLAVIDRNRKATPLMRRIGPIQPKRAYAIAKVGDAGAEDDEDGPGDAKSLELQYVKEGLNQSRWDKQRYDKVMGEMLILQDHIIRNQQTVVDRLFNQQISFFDKLQESQDRALDRELIREKEKFKIGLWKDGMRTARNLLPGIFGGAQEGSASTALASTNNGNGQKDYGKSHERTLVDNFLTDCEEEEELAIALFGDFEEKEGKLHQIKAGIFTIQQYSIMLGVREGRMPVESLFEIMPNSGHANAITQEQVQAAGQAGVTDGIGIALVELLALLNKRKENMANQPEKGE